MKFKPGQSGNPNGKPVGTKNKVTKKRERIIAKEGITPLEFMLQVLRDPANDLDVRLDAAKAAAQYVHPRLSAISHDASESLRDLILASFRG